MQAAFPFLYLDFPEGVRRRAGGVAEATWRLTGDGPETLLFSASILRPEKQKWWSGWRDRGGVRRLLGEVAEAVWIGRGGAETP